MENTSKALLIAAGVLIVILIITFGIKIFSSSSDSIKTATETANGQVGILCCRIDRSLY